MEVSIHFNVLNFIGIAVLAWLAGMGGSVVGLILTTILEPRREYKGYKFLGLGFMACAHVQPLKIIIALVAAGVTLSVCATAASATAWSCGVAAVIAFGFMLLMGSGMKS